MHITTDIKPVTYLKAKAADLLDQINVTITLDKSSRVSDCDPQHAIEEYFEKHQDFPLKLKECLNKAKTFDIYYKTCSSSSSALFRNTTALKSNTFSL